MADPATNAVIDEYLRELQAEARTRAAIAKHPAAFPIDILVSLLGLLLSTKETPEKIVKSTLGIIRAVPALSGRVDAQAPVPVEFERVKNALGMTPSANEAVDDFRELLQEQAPPVRGVVRWSEMVRLITHLTDLPSAYPNLVEELSKEGLNELKAWTALITTVAANPVTDPDEVSPDSINRVDSKTYKFYGGGPIPGLEVLEEAVVVADLNQLPPEVIANFMIALDRVHRAFGGAGLVLKEDYIAAGSGAEVGSQ